ncbi:uncharacterized protein LOC128390725 [Panonychus citri]|uniref:uncharacterized protein LOC128390725 n=1 Tax=Panonychus citri TaxID=50023 RepID=UPI002307EC92|nr:uncharacterized protein LOC128390725 [Panonychus citri]
MQKINHRPTVNCNNQWIIFCSMCHSNSNKQRPIINGLKVNSSNNNNNNSLCENRVYRYSHYSYSPPLPHHHHYSSLLSSLTQPSSNVSIIFQLLLLILSIPWINCDSLNNNNNTNINKTNNIIHHHLHHQHNHHHHHNKHHLVDDHQPPSDFDYSQQSSSSFPRIINRRQSTKQGCPNKCECIWRGGKYEVDCKGLTYSKIPKEIHSDTQVINFNGNRIKTLEPKIFQTYGLINLQKIYLSNCSLKKIPDDSFISLTNLVELDLSNNYLDHIPVGALRETRSLRRLYLNLNAIKKIDSSAFVHLNSLQLLDLSNCAITSIQANSFEGLEKLNYLLLNGNKLKDLPGSILDSLVSLKQINLHENHWFCDCRIIDLRSGLIDRSISITVPPICDKPIRLKGSSWQNLGPDEFACSPKITSLTSAKFIKGSNGTITCRIHSTPMSNVSWYFESNQISRQIIKNSTYMSFGKQYVTIRDTLMDNGQTSKLTITETMEKDSGTYICYASNKAGNASNSIVIGVIQPEHSGEEELRSSDKDEQIGIILATILVFLLVILSVCFIFLRNKTSLFSSIFKTSNTENLAGEKIESNSTLDPSYHNCKPTLTNHIINKSIDNEQDRKRPFNQLTSKSSSTTSTIGAKDTIVITQSNGSLLTSDTLVKVFPPDQHSTTINDNNLSPNISNKSPDGSGFEKCLESYLMMSEDENSMLLPNRTNNSTIENQVDYNSIIQQQQESTDQQLTSLLSQEQLNHHLHHPQQQQQQAINWGQDVYDQSNIYSNRSLNRRYSDSSASLMVKQLNNNLIPVINSSRVTVHDDNSIELLTRSNNNNHPTTTATIDRFRPRRLSEGIITNRVNGLWNRNHHLISATINIHPNEDYSNWSIGQHNQQQQQHVVINNNDPDYLGKVNLIGSEKDSLLRRNGFANYDYSTLQSHRRCSKSGLSSLHNNNVVNNNSSAYLRALSLEDSSLSPTFPVIHESAKEYESELKN